MPESDTLSAFLARMRGEARTVGDVAAACGFSKSMVYGWEADPTSETHYYRRVSPANLQKLLDHYKRLSRSAKVLLMKLPMPPEELVDLTIDLLRRNGFRQDAYIRPTLYKSTEAIGVRLHNLEEDLLIFTVPFGEYIAIDRGISAQVVSWRRNSDQALPARAKIGYVAQRDFTDFVERSDQRDSHSVDQRVA